jgi:osmotically-inducible protein OsmY
MEAEALPVQVKRPDEDIADDIAALIRSYPPLKQARHWFIFEVRDGVVTLRGNLKSSIACRVLLDNVPDIPGVERVVADELYVDSDLSRRIAREADLPAGVLVSVDFGRVILSGALPARRKAEPLVKKVAKIKGVREVLNRLV